MDTAWVTVRLRDVNDNPPLFSRPHAHVTVREDAAPGTPLAALPARDPDAVSRYLWKEGKKGIKVYHVHVMKEIKIC